jgi:hypothetical protein
MELAAAQQFHARAWCSPARDDRVTRYLNAGNIEDRLAGARRAGRNGECRRQIVLVGFGSCETLILYTR